MQITSLKDSGIIAINVVFINKLLVLSSTGQKLVLSHFFISLIYAAAYKTAML